MPFLFRCKDHILTASFEFAIEIPSCSPPTRTSLLDRLEHRLSAFILDESPCYDISQSLVGSDRASTTSSPTSLSLSDSLSTPERKSKNVSDESTGFISRLKRLILGLTEPSITYPSRLRIMASCSESATVYSESEAHDTSAAQMDVGIHHRQALDGYGSVHLWLSNSKVRAESLMCPTVFFFASPSVNKVADKLSLSPRLVRLWISVCG